MVSEPAPARERASASSSAGVRIQGGSSIGLLGTGPICFAILLEPFHRSPHLRLRLARPRTISPLASPAAAARTAPNPFTPPLPCGGRAHRPPPLSPLPPASTA